MRVSFSHCPMCDGTDLAPSFAYDARPEGETDFDLKGGAYERHYNVCRTCGHFSSNTEMDLSALYDGAYVDATYSNADGMRQTFERIIGFPPERSDNTGRVARINAFRAHWPAWGGRTPSALDIGSGLAVFPYALTQTGWNCTALDPDERAAEHAREAAGVAAVAADFLTVDTAALGAFDLITLNKVLEHVIDPIEMLARCRDCLAEDGAVYIELPDGEAAADDGPGREEFFVEHHHVFSVSSIALLIQRAGFRALAIERLREPSSKFTLRAFMVPDPTHAKAAT